MAMMAKMRSLAPAFIITVGALFVLFMVISDSNVLEVLGARTNYVGSVNGEDISYQEYNAAIEKALQDEKQRTGKDIEEEQMDMLREQVWQSLVQQKLLEQQMKKFDISVSDAEIEDVVFGDNPPEFLRQQFTDSLGNFNKQAYLTALKSPENQKIMLQVEDYLKQQLLQQKLLSQVSATMAIGEDELLRTFKDQNIKYNFNYAFFDLNKIPDTEIKVEDSDLKNYYDKNQDKFRVKAQRKLDYVLFETKPSVEDSSTAKRTLEEVFQLMKGDTASFQSFVETHSSQPYSRDTLEVSALPVGAENTIIGAAPGSIVGPVAAADGFYLVKVISTLPSENQVVKAQHILINQFGDSSKNLAEANKIYDRLVNGEDFSTLAKQVSQDPGSGRNGGDLGWFGKGQMVPEFENAAFSTAPGSITKPIKTQFGYHIIKVNGKSSQKFVVEKIVQPLKPSATTREDVFNAAKDFTFIADKNGFEQEAKLGNLDIQKTTPFTKDAFMVPGLGMNKRLIDWSFEADQGDVSEPFKVQNGYAVVKVSEVINEGVEPFDKIKDQLKFYVVKEKKYEKAKAIVDKVQDQLGGDLTKAPQIDNRFIVDTTGIFSFETQNIPEIGRDFGLLYEVSKAPMNKVTEPIKGLRGYYIVNVTERTSLDQNAYNSQRAEILNRVMQQKRQSFLQLWMAKLQKESDIEDNRYKFYGQ